MRESIVRSLKKAAHVATFAVGISFLSGCATQNYYAGRVEALSDKAGSFPHEKITATHGNMAYELSEGVTRHECSLDEYYINLVCTPKEGPIITFRDYRYDGIKKKLLDSRGGVIVEDAITIGLDEYKLVDFVPDLREKLIDLYIKGLKASIPKMEYYVQQVSDRKEAERRVWEDRRIMMKQERQRLFAQEYRALMQQDEEIQHSIEQVLLQTED